MLMSKKSVVFIALIFLSAAFSAIHAQTAGGKISGVVTDSSGAAVPNSQVSVKSVATGISREATTTEDGLYTVPNLNPGIYEVRVSATGFSTVVRPNLKVEVGSELALNIELAVGNINEQVVVNTEPNAVELSSSTLSDVVNERTVRELPLNGRDWTSLATLQPGVANIRTQSPVSISNQRANRGLGAQLTIDGNRPQQNNYRLDGISINDYSNGAPGSVLGIDLGVDAIQEFSVITSNASAEYGKSSGGIINAASRTGSNAFHGSVYEFLRNSAFDARNFFDNLPNRKIPPFKRNQFGIALGGPLYFLGFGEGTPEIYKGKDKTFFFFDYEGLRQNLAVNFVSTVPSAAARTGQLTGGAVTVDPRVVPYLSLYPLPNGAVNGDTGLFSFAGPQVTNQNFFTARIDHKISDKDSIFGTYLRDNGDSMSPDTFNFRNIATISQRRLYTVQEDHIFKANFLNSVRFGLSRVVSLAPITASAINPAAADISLGFVPGLAVGLINVSGIANFQGGLGAVGEFDFHYNDIQFYDDAFYTKGAHSIKFGGVVERIQANQLGKANPNGQYVFGSLANFLTNRPTSFNAPLSNGVSPRNLRQTLFGAYVQDDWKFRPNLNFNLGVRYETATVPTEVNNELSVLSNITDAQPRIGSPYFNNPTKRNFAPRVGFAYDPFKNGKTSVRGAFGVYDVLPLTYQFQLLSIFAAPFQQLGNIAFTSANQLGTFPNGGFPLLTPFRLRYSFIEQNPKRNYILQWNLNVEREIAPNLSVLVAYVGSHGVHQPTRVDDVNTVQPTLNAQGRYQFPLPIGSGTRLNPNVGQISALFYSGSSSYNAMHLQITKRLSRGFQIQGSYTWAKSIDTSSSSIAGDAFGNSVSSLPLYNLGLVRGLSDFDVRHNLVINYLWQIPAPKSLTGIAAGFLKGWQLGGIFQDSSGLPFTATIGGDSLGLKSNDPYGFPDRVDSPECKNPVNPGNPVQYIKIQCFNAPPLSVLGNAGRNTLTGPGLIDFDMSLVKNTHISEKFNVQFRAEAFNIFNHPNFSPPTNPNRQVFNSSLVRNSAAGRLTSTSNTSRQIQFAVKLIF